MNIEFILLGTSPLLQHNIRLADPLDEITREIKALTGKRKKTDEDNRAIELLEWEGGLYLGACRGNKVLVAEPCKNVRKALINTGRISKQGKNVERALIMTEMNVPLIYEGSDRAADVKAEVKRLRAERAFVSRELVGIGKKRVMRARPQFSPWALIVPALFIPDAGLNFDELQRLTDLAGRCEHLGDNRVNGMGAFRGHVREVYADTPPIKASLGGVRDFFDALDRMEDAA